MESKYNLENMPSSKHYVIDVAYSEEIKRDTYIAVNRETGVAEFPFTLYGDAKTILNELEENHRAGVQTNQP